MKKILVLSMLVSLAMICSCQKKDSAAEQQLAQRKTELDAREEELAQRKSVLDEREKALNQREKELDQRERSLAEKAKMNARPNPTDVQDPAQVEAEKQRIIQQLSTMSPPDTSQFEQGAQTQPGLGESQGQKQLRPEELETIMQRKLKAAGISPTPQ